MIDRTALRAVGWSEPLIDAVERVDGLIQDPLEAMQRELAVPEIADVSANRIDMSGTRPVASNVISLI